jgi:hypothetical protein
MRQITGVVRFVTHSSTSRLGNPSYQFSIAGDVILTAANSMLGYSIKNYEGKKCTATVRILRNKLTLEQIEEVQ